jgi:hypothetical protein
MADSDLITERNARLRSMLADYFADIYAATNALEGFGGVPEPVEKMRDRIFDELWDTWCGLGFPEEALSDAINAVSQARLAGDE